MTRGSSNGGCGGAGEGLRLHGVTLTVRSGMPRPLRIAGGEPARAGVVLASREEGP